MKRIIALLMAFFFLPVLAGCRGHGVDLPLEWTVSIASGGGEVLQEPPVLNLTCGSNITTALLGTYTWNYDKGNGTWSGVCADSAHPLQSQKRLTPIYTNEGTLTLSFAAEPESFTVRCWKDTQWENTEAEDTPVQVDGYQIALHEGGYIYEVSAKFSYEQFGGTAHYSFYAVYDDHTHSAATIAQTVADPVSGYCGNTQTTVHLDGKDYTFMYNDSVALTDILINLAYDPAKVCRCMAEFTVDTEFQSGYGINLSESFVRSTEGQADLTQEQVDTIRGILERLK